MVSDILAGMGKSLTFFYSVILDGDTVVKRQAQEMNILLKSPLQIKNQKTDNMVFFVLSHLYAGAEGERKGEDDKEEGEESESQGAESWTLGIRCNQEKNR